MRVRLLARPVLEPSLMNPDQTTSQGQIVEEHGPWGEQDLAELVGQACRTVEQYVQERPHTALGIAAAIGFVLGGGLTPRRLLRLGFAAGGPFLSRQLASEMFKIVTDAMDDSTQSQHGEEHSEHKTGKRRTKRPRSETD
jgi:hypothetical protein